jgi:hypothetical protein
MEWFERGYYYQVQPDVAKQFLVDSMFTVKDVGKYPLAHIPTAPCERGVMISMDAISGGKHYPLLRTLSLEEFADTQIDIIMPTLSNNQEPWVRLRKDLKPGARLVREEGNINGWASLHPEYQNVLTSDIATFQKSAAKNKLLYHQRFDTENIFTYSEPTEFKRITCFMPGFRGVPALVSFAESHDFGGMEFLDYGHHSKLGFLSPKERFSGEMRRASFVWHVKPGGDGFGHVIHNSLAMGRPVITVAADYQNSIVWPLLLDEKTCILIGDNPAENSRKIAALSNPDTIRAMSLAAANRFRNVVDYGWEEEMTKKFLERLV